MNKKVKTAWADPRTGKATVIGEFAMAGEHGFAPPTSGDNNDWVLLLDKAERTRDE